MRCWAIGCAGVDLPALLADHGDVLFPDDYFADLYLDSPGGRPTVPARVLATVMVLQAFEGLSDRRGLRPPRGRPAVAGSRRGGGGRRGVPPHRAGRPAQPPAGLALPRRLFRGHKVVARQAAALGNRARVLDSTPLYDAVATQDTVSQLGAAIGRLLVVLDNGHPALAIAVRQALRRHDDYASAGKPPCDWDDAVCVGLAT